NPPAVQHNLPVVQGNPPAVQHNLPVVQSNLLAVQHNLPVVQRSLLAAAASVVRCILHSTKATHSPTFGTMVVTERPASSQEKQCRWISP
ncbi:hypothetical protein, partial [Caldilinea sp.]|uniref:hypothetical protein n=1 Tax=Caldilinea sp. TaxID=2293560 RepID=UPI002BDF426C|nr:hypothetical protein [Caldilinea sp.]